MTRPYGLTSVGTQAPPALVGFRILKTSLWTYGPPAYSASTVTSEPLSVIPRRTRRTPGSRVELQPADESVMRLRDEGTMRSRYAGPTPRMAATLQPSRRVVSPKNIASRKNATTSIIRARSAGVRLFAFAVVGGVGLATELCEEPTVVHAQHSANTDSSQRIISDLLVDGG
jgi:hypothetical protein